LTALSSFTYQEAFHQLVKDLASLYSLNEREVIAHWAMDHIVGTKTFMWKIEKGSSKMPVDKWELFQRMRSQLLDGMPIQYVIGEVTFYGSTFIVNENVLIPRPETEELIDWIIQDIHAQSFAFDSKVVDLGTGAGIIPVILKKMFPDFEVSGYDIDPKAVEVATENAKLNEAEVIMKVGDILDVDFWTKELGTVDIFISNPPYVLDVEKLEMEEHVLKHEPLHAIFVSNEDPLQFYRALEEIAQNVLQPKGIGYLELSALFAVQTQEFFIERGWKAELRTDLIGRNRMLKFYK